MSSNWSSEIGRIAGIAAMAFFALLTAAQAWRYFRTALGLSVVPRRWLRRKDAKRGKDGRQGDGTKCVRQIRSAEPMRGRDGTR